MPKRFVMSFAGTLAGLIAVLRGRSRHAFSVASADQSLDSEEQASSSSLTTTVAKRPRIHSRSTGRSSSRRLMSADMASTATSLTTTLPATCVTGQPTTRM